MCTFGFPTFMENVSLATLRKVLKGWGELGHKGGSWRSEIVVERFTSHDNHEIRSCSTLPMVGKE